MCSLRAKVRNEHIHETVVANKITKTSKMEENTNTNDVSQSQTGFISWLKNNNWWISLILAIPLAIIANLITPLVSDRISNYSEKNAIERISSLKEEYNEVKYYHENKTELTLYLNHAIIQMTVIGAFTTIASALLFFIQGIAKKIFPNRSNIPKISGFSVFFSIMLIVPVLIFTIGNKAIKTYNNVKNYEKYEKVILEKIKE